jgi:RNA polymerase sigma-70 factor (ECF subfamily)
LSSSTARLNDLIDAVAEGDRPALEELYKLTCAKLYGVALRILRRPELAEAALREAYLRVWQEAGTYDPRLTDPMIFVVAATRMPRSRSHASAARTISMPPPRRRMRRAKTLT